MCDDGTVAYSVEKKVLPLKTKLKIFDNLYKGWSCSQVIAEYDVLKMAQ